MELPSSKDKEHEPVHLSRLMLEPGIYVVPECLDLHDPAGQLHVCPAGAMEYHRTIRAKPLIERAA